jgi:hypothetical protein
MDERWLFIGWDRACRCAYAEFKAFANSAEFREGTAKILDVIREKHAIALVSDNRRLEGVATHDQLWIRDTWAPPRRYSLKSAPRSSRRAASTHCPLRRAGRAARRP